MGLLSSIRRIHAPVVGVLLVSLVAAGCKTGTGRWGEERVDVPTPTHAYVAEDGTLLLGLYVERELRSWRSGWHWVIVEPEVAGPMLVLDQPADAPTDDATQIRHGIDAQPKGTNARIEPPILGRGLERGADTPTPPTQYKGLKPWTVVPFTYANTFALMPADRPALRTSAIQLYPHSVDYVSPLKNLTKLAALPLLVPAFVFGVVVLTGLVIIWAITGGPKWSFGP